MSADLHAALMTAFVPLLPLDFERHESESIKAAARRERLELASRLASAAIAVTCPTSPGES